VFGVTRARRRHFPHAGATGKQGLLDLAPRLRRRATALVLRLPAGLVDQLEHDASLVRTVLSAARPYGWIGRVAAVQDWRLDAYVPAGAVSMLEQLANRDADPSNGKEPVAVLLRAIDGQWPFPANYQLAPHPLAALDFLKYPDTASRHLGREILGELKTIAPSTVARRTVRARVAAFPRLRKLLAGEIRGPRPRLEGDPRTDTATAAAHIVGCCGPGTTRATVKELRAAIGITRERLEAAYDYLLENNPVLGLAAQGRAAAGFGWAGGGVGGTPFECAAAGGAVHCGSASVGDRRLPPARQPGWHRERARHQHDSAIGTLLQRRLIALDEHRNGR
jgi:hypothetical protein